MSENRDSENRSWDEDDADRAVADLKRSMDRLRGHVGAYREQLGDNDNASQAEVDETSGEDSEA